MGELSSYEVAAARRHIIKRPRLTRLLDETSARIILLVAPAGYGKTTLAREWLEESGQQGLWYFGGPASSDVAALATELSEVLAEVSPGLDSRVRSSLDADLRVEALQKVFTNGLDRWPHRTRLVIDDYDAVGVAPEAEALVSSLILHSGMNVLITARRRPGWVTARRLLYGEIRELGQSVLAMTEAEAHLTLSARPTGAVLGLMALADGWPAVIGLAALAEGIAEPTEALLLPLHEFLADEIFSALAPATAAALTRLSACRIITPELVALLNDGAAPSVIDESLERGLLVRDSVQPVLGMHPLLKDFLERRLRQQPSSILREVVSKLYRHYTGTSDWDEAFDLVTRYDRPDLVPTLVSSAYSPLLNQGRLQTLERWLLHAQRNSLDEPILDLVAAEIAFRRGFHATAVAHASRAARAFGAAPLSARAWNRAGQSAFFLDRNEVALKAHASAEETATTAHDLREALWGQFNCLTSDRVDDAAQIFSRLRLLADKSPQTALRLAHAEASLSMRRGTSLRGPLEALDATLPLSHLCEDPLVLSAFLHSYCYVMVLAAEYSRAELLLRRQLQVVEDNCFDFALPHVQHLKAASALGLRQFTKAASALDRADREADRLGDIHSAINVATLRIRLSLAIGETDRAVRLTHQTWKRIPTRSLWGEWQCSKALVFAAAGNQRRAASHLVRAERVRPTIETRVLASCVRAILGLQGDLKDSHDHVRRAVSLVARTGNYDSFVAAYRAWPDLLASAASAISVQDDLANVIQKAHDTELARTAAPHLPPARGGQRPLTDREIEVLDLISQGLGNKDIARLLFITGSTVKVHVSHIFEKLGVRSRAEAAALFAGRSANATLPRQTL